MKLLAMRARGMAGMGTALAAVAALLLTGGCGGRTASPQIPTGAATKKISPPPAPLLRLPRVHLPEPGGVLLAWDAKADAPPLWLAWKSGDSPWRSRRVQGRPAGPDRLRFRARLGKISLRDGLAYRICAEKDCARQPPLYENRLPGERKEGVSLLVMGGIGHGTAAQRAVARLALSIRKGNPPGSAPKGAEMAIFLGDLSPSGTLSTGPDASFFRPFGELMASVPAFAVPGPHDLPPDCGSSFLRRFGLPGRFYALRRGEALLLFLDTNRAADYRRAAGKRPGGDCAARCPSSGGRLRCEVSDMRLRDQEQIAWLAKTLVGAREKWKIAFMRHPLFSGGLRSGYGSKEGKASAEGLQRKLFRLLRVHGVDLVLAAGDPIYERSIHVQDADPGLGVIRVQGGVLDGDRVVFRQGQGPIFVVTGGAGMPARIVRNPLNIPLVDKLGRGDRADLSHPWVGTAALEPHLVHLRIEKKALSLSAWAPGGKRIDWIEIRRPEAKDEPRR